MRLFGYEEDQLILEKLSFHLESNKVYALVGASGSGKSTIAKLIAGFYKPSNGQILLGHKPLESYSQEAAMQQIAFVFQQSKLFKKSIFDNVKLGFLPFSSLKHAFMRRAWKSSQLEQLEISR